jgi:hypothetical protein
MALPLGGGAKVKKLRDVLTPEHYAKNYNLVTNMLANALSFKDLDELKALLNGTTRTEEEINDQLEVAKAFFPKDTKPQVLDITNSWGANTGNKALVGNMVIPVEFSTKHGDGSVTKKVEDRKFSYDLRFEKQKWSAAIYAWYGKVSGKRFDDDGEAVKWLVKQVAGLPKKYGAT